MKEEIMLAQQFVKHGLLTQMEFAEAVGEAAAGGCGVVEYLVKRGLLARGIPSAPAVPAREKTPQQTVKVARIPKGLRGYVLSDLIGTGALGKVHKAWQVDPPRHVAVKILEGRAGPLPEGLRRRYVEAARACLELDHPNVVEVIEAGEENGRGYIVTELVQGLTLKEWLKKVGPPRDLGEVKERALHLAAIAAALHYVHSNGIIHRNLTSSNILVRLAEDRLELMKLTDIDLGVDSMAEALWKRRDEILSPPASLSPEQLRGKISRLMPAADLFSMGCVLYEAFTGLSPFLRSTVDTTIGAILTESPAPPSHHQRGLPAPLDGIILKCLVKQPGDRTATADLLAEHLTAIAEDREIPRDELRLPPAEEVQVPARKETRLMPRNEEEEDEEEKGDALPEERIAYRKGKQLQKAGNLEGALKEYARAIKISPKYVKAWVKRGLALYQSQKVELAMEAWNRAIEIDADALEAYVNRAMALRAMKKFDEAMQDYATALERAPKGWPHREQVKQAMDKTLETMVGDV